MYSIKIPLTLFSATMFANAVVIDTSTPTANPSTPFFSDGGSDYFGVVDNSGLIAGTIFSSNVTSPPIGSLAGRDHDDGNSRPEIVIAEWALTLPSDAQSGTGLSNIIFSATVAAKETGWLDNSIQYELLINGVVTSTRAFYSSIPSVTAGVLLEDTNADQVGDGTAISSSGTSISLSDSGGSAINSVILRATIHSARGDSEHWTLGSLSADYTQAVPEPSSLMLLGLGTVGFLSRRSRQ